MGKRPLLSSVSLHSLELAARAEPLLRGTTMALGLELGRQWPPAAGARQPPVRQGAQGKRRWRVGWEG